ncbi:hypothetical protein Q31a_62130 [Aureliella helgolandensis]|uniref:Uncharacterized protein n=1 Tax=Aureliella helgolandensis TaxID=2527968 RepID=A0A518GGW8_9BACT|nr:hypothetical protein Q31a_62130 [Aureliella helgolandensis]
MLEHHEHSLPYRESSLATESLHEDSMKIQIPAGGSIASLTATALAEHLACEGLPTVTANSSSSGNC